MKYNFMINKIPLNGLNSIAARKRTIFVTTRSSILNKILRRSVNSPDSGSIVHINSEESATHLVINKILLNKLESKVVFSIKKKKTWIV